MIGGFVVLTVGLLLASVAPAHAWGAGMHYYLAQRILEFGFLSGAMGGLIQANREQFLFGNIIADVIVGKNMIEVDDHSHNWNVARNLRTEASGDKERSFALGYWTHLAADTVAHNTFLEKERSGFTFTTPKMAHIYLELLADTWVPASVAGELESLLEHDFKNERNLLERTVPRTVLPFRMNWFLMDNTLKFTGRGTTRRLAETMDEFHPYSLADASMEYYFELALDRMRESLNGNKNRITRLNPMSKGTRFMSS